MVKSVVRLIAAAAVVAAVVISSLSAQTGTVDWTQWRGPNRDGVVASFAAPKSWPEQLTRKWKIDVGLGYASPVLVGNRLFIFSRQGDNEVPQALDAEKGIAIWQASYAAPFAMNPAAARHEKGPKSTPTFAGG